MPSDVAREEFGARVGVLEREVEGEKLVTRHVLEQTRRNGDDLAAIKTRLDRVERKVDDVVHEVGGLRHALDGLIRDLPKIVGDAVHKPSKRRDRE
jgi:uncharacterized protein YoxC